MNVEQTAGKSPFLGVILIVRQFIIGRLASDIDSRECQDT